MTQAMLAKTYKELTRLYSEANAAIGNRAPEEQIDFVTWGYVRGRLDERRRMIDYMKGKGWLGSNSRRPPADKAGGPHTRAEGITPAVTLPDDALGFRGRIE